MIVGGGFESSSVKPSISESLLLIRFQSNCSLDAQTTSYNMPNFQGNERPYHYKHISNLCLVQPMISPLFVTNGVPTGQLCNSPGSANLYCASTSPMSDFRSEPTGPRCTCYCADDRNVRFHFRMPTCMHTRSPIAWLDCVQNK